MIADIRAIVPSYRPDVAQLRRLMSALSEAGAHPVVLANGKPALDVCLTQGLAHLDPGKNAGFGPSIAWAVDRLAEWDWLLLANDDLEIEIDSFRAALEGIEVESRPLIVHLDEDIPRAIPNGLSVFMNLSLLARIAERFKRRALPAGQTYRSFSCVLINRAAWDATGGFDRRFPFTYEDADLVRRLWSAGGAVEVRASAGVHHERSKTSSRSVEVVLPVASWSALAYLEKWTKQRVPARVLVAAALLLRIPLVPLGTAQPRAHLRGIVAALRAVVIRRRPPMPPYDPRG